MVKFTANSDPSTGTGNIGLNTFDDLNIKDANISNIQTVSLDVAEGLNVDGTVTAASITVDLGNIGNIKVSDNIIELIDGSIYSEIIIRAPTVTIDSTDSTASYAKIKSDELEVKDTVINIGKDNISDIQDRGILFDYISGENTLQGFFGFNPHDSYFRMLTNITDYANNIAYNKTDNTKYDLGNLELTKLIVTNIQNNNKSNDLNIIAQDNMNLTTTTQDLNIVAQNNMNLTATTQNINITATNGDINIKSSNNNKSVFIGNGLDSKTVFNSNVLVNGTLDAKEFAFFNSNESIYATKNILLYLDNSVKVDAIVESPSGTYIITFNEDRTGYSAGNYIYFEGTNELSAFNGIHVVQSVDSSDPTSVITINYTAGITIPAFTSGVYAILGVVTKESLSSNTGFSVISYEDNDKTLREHKFQYEFDSNSNLDSSWKINRNLKTDNTLLLKPQDIYYNNHSGFTRLQVKDDGELYFVNSNGHECKISNRIEEDICNLTYWSLSNKQSIYSYNKVVINDSNIGDNFELRVKGNVDITGDINAGDVVFNNADLTGSFSVNGFKSTNINTHTLTVKDNNFQIGFYNVLEIDKLYSTTDALSISHFNDYATAIDKHLFVRVEVKLQDGQIAFFQDCNVYYSSDATNYTSINGMRAIKKIDKKIVQIYTDKTTNNIVDGTTIKLYRSSVNPPKYIGINNRPNTIIDNIPFGTDASVYPSNLQPIRIRIFIDSFDGTNYTFKYSINSGFSYVNTNIAISSTLSTIYYLTATSGLSTADIINSDSYIDLGIKIRFTDISQLSVNDYWEFDCAPTYKSSLDDFGELVKPKSINFLGEFGYMLENTNIQDSGFEVMFHDGNNLKTSEKFSFFYNNDNDAYWKLTNNIHVMGTIQMETKTDPTSNIANQGQLVYRDDKKLHFINEDNYSSILDNEFSFDYNLETWNLSNDQNTIYSFYKVGINLSNPDKQFEVNGEARIRNILQVDNNLILKKDGVVLNFGDDSDVNLTHVHNTGLLLNSTMQLQFGEAGEYISGDGTNLSIVSGGAINIDASGAITIDASGTNAISIGSDTNTGNINIGNGASARTITIGADESTKVDINALAIEIDGGSTGIIINSAADLTIDSTTLSIDSTDTTNLTMTADNDNDKTLLISAINGGAGTGLLDIQSDGNLTIDSSGGTIGIGTDNNTGAINIGTNASARTLTIGNTTAATEVIINSGSTGKVTIGTIKSGTWEGTAIAPTYGGIGADISSIAKGGLLSGTGSGTLEIKTVGTNDNVLIADSTATGGISWGSVTNAMLAGSIANEKLSNSSITVSDGTNSTDIALGGTVTFASANFSESSGTISLKDNSISLAQLSDLTRGSIIYGNGSGQTAELTKGTANTVLFSDGTDISWGSVTNNILTNSSITISDSESTPNTSNISLGGAITFASSGLATVLENNGTVTIGCSASLNDLSDVTVASNKITFGDGNTIAILPTDDNEVDLGASEKQFKNLYINGTAYLDAIGFGTTSLTLPTDDGSANQVLSTDGSGTLSWVTIQSSLTFGISNTNTVKIDGTPEDDDYAKFTANGIEGRSVSEIKTDLSLDNVENTALSTWTGSSNITTLGEINYKRKTLTTQADGTTLSVNDSGAVILQSTTDATLTLPSSTVGVTFTFIWIGAATEGFTISPDSSDKIVGSIIDTSGSIINASNSGAGTTDKDIILGISNSSTVGNRLTLMADGNNNWIITEGLGDWSFES